MDWYKVPGIQNKDLPFFTRVKINHKQLCIVGYEGKIFALSANCPHAGADLSYGWCKDGKLICPLHRYAYDLKTGKGNAGQNDYIDAFAVKIKDGEIYIGMNSFWQKIKQAFNL